MKNQYVQLPASLRKYIRRKKADIRREHGINSEEEKEFIEWVKKKRQEKRNRLQNK